MTRGEASVAPVPAAHARSVADLLADAHRPGSTAGVCTVSFEFFPPRDADGARALWRTLHDLEALHPSFVSVTYGAGGSGREYTIELTRRIAAETTLLPLAHLTVVDHSVAELRHLLGSYAAAGVRNVLALRGDPPGDPGGPWRRHPAGLEHADQLVALTRSVGDFCVGVAAFPTRHPRSADTAADDRVLVAKQAAGARFAITQMFFDVDQYLRLRDRATAHGVHLPIVAGIMPVTNVAQIERFATLMGSSLPPAFADRLLAVADDPAAVRTVGIDHCRTMCSRLMAEGVPGLHFITLNRSTATRQVCVDLGLD
jgi:methylenetetrahydrofolate reductase (NADPH)